MCWVTEKTNDVQTSGAEEFGPDSPRDVSDEADGDSACGTLNPVSSDQCEGSARAAVPSGPGCRQRARDACFHGTRDPGCTKDARFHGTQDPSGPRQAAAPAPAAAWSFLAFSSCLDVLGFILLIKRTRHCLYKRRSNSYPSPDRSPYKPQLQRLGKGVRMWVPFSCGRASGGASGHPPVAECLCALSTGLSHLPAACYLDWRLALTPLVLTL